MHDELPAPESPLGRGPAKEGRMSSRTGAGKDAKPEREARLAEALRANLKRRKAQQRKQAERTSGQKQDAHKKR
jgi:hypothetical protein